MSNLLNQKVLHKTAKEKGSRNASINRVLEYAIKNFMMNPNEFTNEFTNHRSTTILQRSNHLKGVSRKLFVSDE